MYYKTKYVESPLFFQVLDSHTALTAIPDSQLTDVALEMLDQAGFGPREWITEVTQLQWLRLFDPEDNVKKSISILLAWLLMGQKRLDSIPPKYIYRVDPSLPFDVAVMLAYAADFAEKEMRVMLPPPNVRIRGRDVVDALLVLRSDFALKLTELRNFAFRALEGYQKILFKLMMGSPLTQFEKTYVLHCRDACYGFSDLLNTHIGDAKPMDSVDPRVDEMLRKIESVTLKGPKIKYVGILSNAQQEGLIFCSLPMPTNLSLIAGDIGLFKGFSRCRFSVLGENLKWSEKDHLTGVAQRVLAFSEANIGTNPGPNDAGGSIRIMVSYTKEGTLPDDGLAIPSINDFEDVTLVFFGTPENPGIRYQYFLRSAGRIVEDQNCNRYIVDLARNNVKVGGTESGGEETLPNVSIADLTELTGPRFYTKGSKIFTRLRSRIANLDSECFVVYRKAMDSKPKTKMVNMRGFISQLASVFIRPAFSEYLSVPLSWLERDCAAALDFICSRSDIELTVTDRLLSEQSLKICFNYWYLKTMFGSTPNLPSAVNTPNEVAAEYARLYNYVLGTLALDFQREARR